MLGHHITGFESSLLPTVKARDSQPEGYEAGLRRSQPQVGTIVKGIVDQDPRVMFRTPSAIEGQGGAISEDAARDRGRMLQIRDQVAQLAYENGLKVSPAIEEQLLGTPRATAADSSSVQVSLGAPKGRLEDQVLLSWGKFEPAIRRWEGILGRKSPEPTKPDGTDGSHRISSSFTEWLMGLPEGWITDCGLTRTEELKAAGNGVVPQQAYLALEILLGPKA